MSILDKITKNNNFEFDLDVIKTWNYQKLFEARKEMKIKLEEDYDEKKTIDSYCYVDAMIEAVYFEFPNWKIGKIVENYLIANMHLTRKKNQLGDCMYKNGETLEIKSCLISPQINKNFQNDFQFTDIRTDSDHYLLVGTDLTNISNPKSRFFLLTKEQLCETFDNVKENGCLMIRIPLLEKLSSPARKRKWEKVKEFEVNFSDLNKNSKLPKTIKRKDMLNTILNRQIVNSSKLKVNLEKLDDLKGIALIMDCLYLTGSTISSIYKKWFINYFEPLIQNSSEKGVLASEDRTITFRTSSLSENRNYWSFRDYNNRKDRPITRKRTDFYLFICINVEEAECFETIEHFFFLFPKDQFRELVGNGTQLKILPQFHKESLLCPKQEKIWKCKVTMEEIREFLKNDK